MNVYIEIILIFIGSFRPTYILFDLFGFHANGGFITKKKKSCVQSYEICDLQCKNLI